MAANLQNYQDLLDTLIAEVHSQSWKNKQEADQTRLLAFQETLQQERAAITTLHKDLEGALLLELSGEFPDLAAMASALKNVESHYQKLGERYRKLYEHWKENFAPPIKTIQEKPSKEPEVTDIPPNKKPNSTAEKNQAQAAVKALNKASLEATAKAASITDQQIELKYRKLFSADAPIVTVDKVARTDIHVVRAESWAIRRSATRMLVRKEQPAVDQFRSRLRRNEADTPLKSTFSMRQSRLDIKSSGPSKEITPEEAARLPLLKNTAGRGLQHKQPRYTKPKFNTIIPCVSCESAGYKKCKDCDENRQINCSGCGGKGKNDCYQCKGTTNVPCKKCGGSGTDACPYCDGKGKKRCKICRGTGVNGMLKCTYCNEKGHTGCPHCTAGRIKCGMKVGTTGCGGTTTEKCPTCGGSGKRRCVYCNGKQTFACTTCHADVTNPKTYGKTTCPECRGKGYFIEHHFVETDVLPPEKETYLVGADNLAPQTKDQLMKWYAPPGSLPLVYSALPGLHKISAYLTLPEKIKAARTEKRRTPPVMGYLSYATIPVATLTCRNVLTNHTFTVYLIDYGSDQLKTDLHGHPWDTVPTASGGSGMFQRIGQVLKGKKAYSDQYKERLLLLFAAGIHTDFTPLSRTVLSKRHEDKNLLSPPEQQLLRTHFKERLKLESTDGMAKFANANYVPFVTEQMRRIMKQESGQLNISKDSSLNLLIERLDTYYINRRSKR